MWESQKVTQKAANRAKEHSSSSASMTPFEFLQKLLVKFSVFVPIDWSVERALLGGADFSQFYEPCNSQEGNISCRTRSSQRDNCSPKFFFLPSLLGPGEPSEAWTYKCGAESWKTTLCHSWLFPDFVPPGLMERITATVLRDIYSVLQNGREQHQYLENSLTSLSSVVDASDGSMNDQSNLQEQNHLTNKVEDNNNGEGTLRLREILCWRTAFLLKLGMEVLNEHGGKVESHVEVFVHLVERESPLCVASDSMSVGMRRLIVSGNGQVGDGGRKIWKGKFL